jgi:hypothetical protein
MAKRDAISPKSTVPVARTKSREITGEDCPTKAMGLFERSRLTTQLGDERLRVPPAAADDRFASDAR